MNILDLSRAPGGFMASIHPATDEDETAEPGLDLDLGGIGKGYSLDRSLDLLRDWGIEDALIHGGTSTALASGSPTASEKGRKGWPVSVGGGFDCPGLPKEFFLFRRALSGSGTEAKGRHIFDPRSGLPAGQHLAAWASHPSAAAADALSTAFMVMSTEEVEAFCNSHPEVWAMVIIDSRTFKVFNPKFISG